MARQLRLGFDIGGTFTDFVLVDEADGTTYLGKSLTTPDDPSRGVAAGLLPLLERIGADGAELSIAIHATTLITNALIERRGARTALLATRGFRDVIEMGTELRYDNYAIAVKMPEPLVPRDRRYDVPERLDRDGKVVEPLDEAAVRAIARALRDAAVETVAVSYLHSFRNPVHERRTAAILREELPDVLVSLSSDVAPEIREYERTSTTVANAYVQPLIPRYLDRALGVLGETGYSGPLYVMVSSGGIAGSEAAKALPIRMLESGPTAGVMAAIYYGRAIGMPDLVTFDMGGTTAKIGIVKNHEAKKSNLFEVGRVARFQKGSGIPVKIPMVELIEIGAGGGSVASVNALGLLGVGPESAGAAPGPACYGRGGTRPTVTDANVVLGLLDPDYFLGGAMRLDRAAAVAAFESEIAAKLGLGVEECAQGVFDIVNQNMLAASRVHIAERGEDPRRLYLFAFGGAGPAHAYELARALHMRGVVVPRGAGAASALGLVASPVSFDFARSFMSRLDLVRPEALAALFAEMVADGMQVMAEAGVPAEEVQVQHLMDLRHLGQGYEVTIPVPASGIDAAVLAAMPELFFAGHEARFGHSHRHLPVELMTCRTIVSGNAVALPLTEIAAGTGAVAPKRIRDVYFPEIGGYVPTPVYDRAAFGAGDVVPGPAVIEERECTIIAGPSATIRTDRFGSLLLDLGEPPPARSAARLADADA